MKAIDLKRLKIWHIAIVIILAFLAGLLISPSSAPAEEHAVHAGNGEATIWTCSMHPQIRMKEKGQCPICGMDLIPASSGDDSTGPWELSLSEKARKLASIQETTVERRYVAHEVRVVGKVEPNEQLISNITARFPGRIDRLYVDFAGMTVRKGDHLVSLYSPELISAQKELLEAVKSQKTGPAGLSSAAKARVNATREKLRLWNLTEEQIENIEKRGTTVDHVTLYAPTKGIVLSKHAVEGDYIKTGSPIYTISDLSKIWVKLDIYESDLKWIRLGQIVDFSVEAFPGETFSGKLVFIDPILNDKTRTIRVRINVPNPDMRLKPEMFVRAVIYAKLGQSGGLYVPELIGKWMCPMHPEEVFDKKGTCGICGMDLESTASLGYVTQESTATDAPLIIPTSAALMTGTRAVVYVAVPGKQGSYEGREIQLGPKAGNYYTVLSGLKKGERVVTHGAFKIDSELQIQAKTSMMYAASEVDAAEASEPFKPDPAFLSSAHPMVDAFFLIPKALSDDSLPEMKKSAQQMQSHFKQLLKTKLTSKELYFWDRLEKEIVRNLSEMTRVEELEAARLRFSDLDQNMVQLIKKFGLVHGQTVTRFHCPMAFNNEGAYWLQKGSEPANPYFGAQMITCFDTREVIAMSELEMKTQPSGATAPKTGKKELPDSYASALSSLFSTYFQLQAALADDHFAEAKAQLQKLPQTLEGLDMSTLSSDTHEVWMPWKSHLTTLLKDSKSVEDLEQVRIQFEAISTSLQEASRVFQWSFSGNIYGFHCPMAFDGKGADWMQTGKTLKNPYFGKAMLSCGSLTETIVGGQK